MKPMKQRVLEAAKVFIERQSWPWIEPVEMKLTATAGGEKAWSIWTNAQTRGNNVRLLVREIDLAVLEHKFLPR